MVLLLSERLKSGAESDARAILGYLLLRKLMVEGSPAPPVLVELTDPDNIVILFHMQTCQFSKHFLIIMFFKQLY